MALQQDISGPIKKVLGVYKGQESWQDVGDQLYSARGNPFFLGFFQGDSSISANIFFDPTQSPLVNRFGALPLTGLIQVGEFFINHYSLPIDFYDAGSEVPDTDNFIDFNGRDYPSQVAYTDICKENSAGARVTHPLFPFWQLSNDASYDPNMLFRSPQTYGGLTKFDPKTNNLDAIKDGENLTAFLTSNQELTLGDLPPSLNLQQYVDSIPVENFEFIPTELTTDSTYIQIDDFLLENGYIAQTFRSDFSRVKKFLPGFVFWISKIGNQRLLLQVPTPYIRSGANLVYFRHLLVCKNPSDDGTLCLVWMDDDFANDYQDALKESGPDLGRLKANIEDQYSYSFYNFGATKLSKQFITFACNYAVDYQTNVVSIRMLEGVTWGISNRYDDTNQWGNLALIQPKDCTRDVLSRFRFKNAVERYYKELTQSLSPQHPYQVEWVNDFNIFQNNFNSSLFS